MRPDYTHIFEERHDISLFGMAMLFFLKLEFWYKAWLEYEVILRENNSTPKTNLQKSN